MENPESRNSWVRRAFILIVALFVISGSTAAFLITDYLRDQAAMAQNAQRNAMAQAAPC